MRRLLILIFCAFTVGSVSARNWDEMRGSSEYLYGEGWGASVAEADENALKDLISKISVHIISSVSQTETQTVANTEVEYYSSFSSVIETYTAATLTNTEKELLKNEPDAHVVRWIKRSDIDKIFEGRKNKIGDYIASALKAEKTGKIDVALKDLYWALSLTKTLQHPATYRYITEEGDALLAETWIPHHINEIFANLKVDITKRTGDDVELNITYDGKPVNSVDYTYFDGRDWSNIYSAKDGIGILELAPGCQNTYYDIKFEYEYRGEAQIDREVEYALRAVKGTPMPNCKKSIKAGATVNNAIAGNSTNPAKDTFASVPSAVFNMPAAFSDTTRYKQVLGSLSSAIVAKRYDDPGNFFTPDAKEIYDSLIKYGRASIVGQPEYTFYKYGDNVIVRGLYMSFSFKSGIRKSFVEEVVFSFNDEGKINNISFGLGKTAEADILGKGVWSENARFAIMNFLENYQTAYALMRLDYISQIFDDDAVIITGTVNHVKPQNVISSDRQQLSLGHDIIRYNRFTKDAFLRHLEKSFASKEYINLRLSDNEVRKLGKGGELYAIQISQEYYSSNYGDKGYLFLMVDINDPNNPIIKVRTWQPEKDPTFGLYGPEHFK